MKLNKILALALTGVMAVSMLAGCGNKDTGNGDGDVVVTPVTGAASILNDKQDKIEFTNVSSAELQKAAEGMIAKDLATGKATAPKDTNDALYNRLVALDIDDLKGSWVGAKFGQNTDKHETTTAVLVFGVGGAYSMDEAVKQVASLIDSETTVKDKVVMDDTNDKVYTYSYTGTVSTVTASSFDGSQSANYIMVTITESVAVKDAE